ncbi:hypothetical protein H8S45_04545 [Agathobaculum sp. NSJ-28]|uniref:Uncharacterized protein n=1 Tax=Agathobaculum faecis TaxID=2763013 RepID=A0A923LVI2_9FIRM|nr:hypothetical protein [Agathobaculum faecis]MBC5724729.1 hypothetical protein [Agathobaculum faecis]
MKRYTEKHYDENGYYLICSGNCETLNCGDCGILDKIVDRLAAYEDTGLEPEDIKRAFNEAAVLKLAGQALGITPDRLRELAQADRLLGKKVYEPNKRGIVSTYEVISVHISYCSVLVGWNLIDGIYSNLNGFEISALGKSVFLTRAEAETALRREQDG